jgi:hypothetical protein
MAEDRYGLSCTGTGEAIAHLQRAQARLLRFQPAVIDELDAALAADPGCVMARATRAWIGVLSSEWPDARDAGKLIDGARSALPREQAHLDAIRSCVAGDMHRAGRQLDALLAEHPRDAVALAIGHQIDFFCGDAANLRERVARVRPHWDPLHPDFGFVDGMLAFGCEECGDYVRAEEIGLRAVERNADDVWAIHAVVHTYEMQGRVDDGIAFLEQRRASWAQGNFFNVHNAWHLALYRLEREDWAGALAIYDSVVHHAASPGIALEMVDASGLLWRLTLDGVDTGGRWDALAEAWAAKDATPWYVFNDLHAIMAFVGAGRPLDAEQRVAEIERFVRGDGGAPANRLMAAGAGLAAARALAAYGRGDDATVVALLAPLRHHLAIFGGSHAQRDAFQRTLLAAALRGGYRALAAQWLAERLHAKPHSAWNRRREAQWLQADPRVS